MHSSTYRLPGLKPYTKNESAIFLGRETDIERVSQSLEDNFFTTVLGPSGIGKTSLIEAGIRPEAEKSEINWLSISCGQNPEMTPLQELLKVLVEQLDIEIDSFLKTDTFLSILKRKELISILAQSIQDKSRLSAENSQKCKETFLVFDQMENWTKNPEGWLEVLEFIQLFFDLSAAPIQHFSEDEGQNTPFPDTIRAENPQPPEGNSSGSEDVYVLENAPIFMEEGVLFHSPSDEEQDSSHFDEDSYASEGAIIDKEDFPASDIPPERHDKGFDLQKLEEELFALKKQKRIQLFSRIKRFFSNDSLPQGETTVQEGNPSEEFNIPTIRIKALFILRDPILQYPQFQHPLFRNRLDIQALDYREIEAVLNSPTAIGAAYAFSEDLQFVLMEKLVSPGRPHRWEPFLVQHILHEIDNYACRWLTDTSLATPFILRPEHLPFIDIFINNFVDSGMEGLFPRANRERVQDLLSSDRLLDEHRMPVSISKEELMDKEQIDSEGLEHLVLKRLIREEVSEEGKPYFHISLPVLVSSIRPDFFTAQMNRAKVRQFSIQKKLETFRTLSFGIPIILLSFFSLYVFEKNRQEIEIGQQLNSAQKYLTELATSITLEDQGQTFPPESLQTQAGNFAYQLRNLRAEYAKSLYKEAFQWEMKEHFKLAHDRYKRVQELGFSTAMVADGLKRTKAGIKEQEQQIRSSDSLALSLDSLLQEDMVLNPKEEDPPVRRTPRQSGNQSGKRNSSTSSSHHPRKTLTPPNSDRSTRSNSKTRVDNLSVNESKPEIPIPEVRLIQGGTFLMGSAEGPKDAQATHQITVNSFFMGQYEVTFEEYDAYCRSKNKALLPDDGWGRGRRPVINVTWEEANAYCRWLTEQTGSVWRLPTEAEWEYAAKGGKNGEVTQYAGGNRLSQYGWHTSNSGAKTHPVGQKRPNELGLFDMSGNVWEWCKDWYGSDYYSKSPSKNPKGPSDGLNKILRGGSWGSSGSNCRVYTRDSFNPYNSDNSNGFRVVRVR